MTHRRDKTPRKPLGLSASQSDPTWLPLLVTPGFPAYTSGHATQSGAAATVLTDLFGITPFTDTLHQDHDLEPRLEPRSFGAFEAAAAEAAMSRLYAGIHYRFDNDHGLAQGRCIGQVIVDRMVFTREGAGDPSIGPYAAPHRGVRRRLLRGRRDGRTWMC
jgi:PAP2 superfamily